LSSLKLEAWERRMKSEHRGKMPELVARAAWCEKQLEVLASLTIRLLEDEHFVTLLRAERLLTIPTSLSHGLQKAPQAAMVKSRRANESAHAQA
jgi:hypothetical protein